VYPALATVESSVLAKAEILVLGGRGIEKELITRAGLPFQTIDTGQLRGRAPWALTGNLIRMVRGTVQAAHSLRQFGAQALLATGGYVSAPCVLAARRLQVPVLIYLPDMTPGLAVRLLSHLADRVAVSFPEVAAHFPPGKAVVTGYPVRRAIREATREAACLHFDLRPDWPTLLVFGGSRGAHSLNRALINSLGLLLTRCQVLHICGELDSSWVEAEREALTLEQQSRYRVFRYLHDEMALALAAADLVVSRAGASTLGEFPVRGLPAILVPYPYAGRHQAANAAYLVRHGAALVVDDEQLDERLVPIVMSLLDRPEVLSEMAAASRRLAVPDAADRLAEQLCELAYQPQCTATA